MKIQMLMFVPNEEITRMDHVFEIYNRIDLVDITLFLSLVHEE